MTQRKQTDIDLLAALQGPTRNRIYQVVRSAQEPLTRDDVAGATGVSARLAGFHLDKLCDLELLRCWYKRPPGRSGPGAGRTSKYYGRSERELRVSIPERRYDLAANILLEAVKSQGPAQRPAREVVRAARARGRRIGQEFGKKRRSPALGTKDALRAASEILAQIGYEPYRTDRNTVGLRNCPFNILSEADPIVVCEMNQAFIRGMLRGLGAEGLDATLTRPPDHCCVTIASRT
jgi:predicted ArsR family transcriptional regulator